jgi:hypothetical protein
MFYAKIEGEADEVAQSRRRGRSADDGWEEGKVAIT